MTLSGVPLFVGGGAENPPEAVRSLAYFATNAEEGVGSSGECKPLAMAVPAGQVRIGPGVILVRNRKAGAFAESYILRNPEDHVVAVPPTGAGAGRSDLVYAVVRDRQYAGEPEPASIAAGPYNFIERVPVAAGTKTVAEAIAQGALPAGTTAVALARVDIPASTATITQGMIVDLRTLPAPRTRRRLLSASPTGTVTLTSTEYVTFPSVAAFQVDVPAWATHAVIHITNAGLLYGVTNVLGAFRAALGTLVGQATNYDVAAASGSSRADFHAIDTLVIPTAMRGTTQTLAMQGTRTSAGGTMQASSFSSVIADIEFQERV
jgi:hypothetical protein